ncbi:MAG: hypothetical protein JWR10_3260 [Rubritepida sp.]|nr:hypothetical protein [Rubritepida sp.]
MMRLSLAAMLLLTACMASVEPLTPTPLMDNAECRAEARSSPEVRNTSREANLENPANLRRVQTERNETEARVYNGCLRRLGLPIAGGVEPIRSRR